MHLHRLLIIIATGTVAAATLTVSAPAAIAGPPPESLTVLTTTPIHVTSSTHKHLLLSVGAIRFANHSTQSDLHSKGTVTVTLSNVAKTESHAWTFDLSTNSFQSSPGGDGHLRTGTQIAPFGALKTVILPLHGGVKRVCGAGNFQVNHKVAVKGTFTLKPHSSGPNSWGVVNETTSLTGKLSGGHGADNEEACSAIPCLGGVSWIANKGALVFSGQNVAHKGKKTTSTIDGNRLVHLANPAHATRSDDVTTTAPAPTFTMLNGHKTLSVTTNAAGPAAGDVALSATGHGPYAQGCATGQEKGTLWNAHYVTADLPLTFSEDIFGPMQIAKTKSANFERYHVL